MHSIKSNFCTGNNVNEGTKIVADKADSVQSARPSFMDSYMTFIKSRNKNISLNIPPESQTSSFKKNHLTLMENDKNVSGIVNESSYLKERKKKKNHFSQLENTVSCDSALENDKSSKLSLPVNRKSILSVNKSVENDNGLAKTVNESNYKKKKRKEHSDSSTPVETAINYDSSVQNDRSATVTELTSPVSRKFIPSENKCLEENSGVTETINESNYLKRRIKTKLKNILHQDLSLKNDRNREITEIRSSELSLPVNGKSISSDDKSLESNCGVSETASESNYLKKRDNKKLHHPSEMENMLYHDLSREEVTSSEVIVRSSSESSLPMNRKSFVKKRRRKNHHGSSRSENEIHYDSLLEKDRSGEVIEIKDSEVSLPSNGKYVSSENKFLKINSGVTETAIKSNYLNKREKKKRHHSPGVENMSHHDSSLLEKNKSMNEMCTSQLSSVVSRKPISSGNYEQKKNNEVSEIVNGSNYFKKGAKNRHDSSRLENVICYDSSLENDRSKEVIEISCESSSPVNRKSISSENKCLEENNGVTDTTNVSNYLKRRKKMKYHTPNLKNTLHQDSSLKNYRNREVTEIRNSELSLTVNGKSISSDNKSLENNIGVSGTTNKSNYLKERHKTKLHHPSEMENMLYHDSSREEVTSSEVIVGSNSESSSPMNRKSFSSENKLVKKNWEGSETVNESKYIKKKKKKKLHYSPNLENMLPHDSSQEKDTSSEVFVISNSESSSPMNRKSISSENKLLKKNSEVSETVNELKYLKEKKKKKLYYSPNLENTLSHDSFQEKDTSSDIIVVSDSESNSPLNRKYISSENKLLKKNSEVSETVNELKYLKKKKKKKHHDFTKLENMKGDSSPEKKRNKEVNKVRHSELTSLSISSENSVFENFISPSKMKRKLEKDNSLMNKCEDGVTLTKRIREKSCTKHSNTPFIEDQDNDCLVAKTDSTSPPERKKRKAGEMNCESCGLKRKPKKMQKQTDQNAADICVVEQSLPLSSKSVGNGKRENKYHHAFQNESSISHDEANADLCTSGMVPSFAVTSQILEKNKLVLPDKKKKNPVSKVFPDLTPLSHKFFKDHNNTIQNEHDLNRRSINTELFQNFSKFSQLHNREMGTQKEINSECSVLTSKEKNKQSETMNNVSSHPESGPQPLLCKRKIKNKRRNTNTSPNSYNKNYINDFCSSESESPVGTNRKENEAKNFVIKSNENKFHKQTNIITICDASENSLSAVLPSSCDEIEKPVNTNLNIPNTDSDDESEYDLFDNESSSSMDLLTFYANKIGNKKEECDKLWNDALTAEAFQNFCEVDVNIRHNIPVLHMDDCSVCKVPTKQEREQLVSLGMKQIPFSKDEDAIIMNNWNDLCEDNSVSSSVLLKHVIKRVGGYKIAKRRIAQYLGNGLPDRALFQIYHRFILLSSSRRGQFTDEENYLLLKAENSQVKEKYAILSSILRRSRNTIYKRRRTLLAFPRDTIDNYEKIKTKWDITFASKVVQLLMRISGASSIEDFRDTIISADLWRQMEKEMKVVHWKLHQCWIYKLHVQLFAKAPVCEKQVQKKIVQWLYRKNYSTVKEINWSESRHLLLGSTSSFMWMQFRFVKNNFQFKNFSGLRDFIKAVYSRRDLFDGSSRYLTRYKVNEDFSLSIVNDEV